jgi:hypothetical protein
MLAKAANVQVWAPMGFSNGQALVDGVEISRIHSKTKMENSPTRERYRSKDDQWMVYSPSGLVRIYYSKTGKYTTVREED